MVSTNNMTKPVFPVAIAALLIVMASSAASDEKKLTFSMEAGVEFNDNISVSSLDTTTEESDEALVFDFSGSYMVLKEEAQEVELTYDFYQSLHGSLDDFDLQIHTLSALGSWEIDDLDTGLDYSYSRIFLGGSRLYESHTLTPSVGFSGLENYYHRLSYAYLNKDFFSLSGRDADQHSLSMDNYYFFMKNRAYVSLGLRLEEEDAKDPELDYQGRYFKLGASIPLAYGGAQPVKLEANYQHYWRDYDNVTASIGEHRDDKQDSISIALIKPIYNDVSVKFNYEYTNTDSNLPSVDSDENILTLSLMAEF